MYVNWAHYYVPKVDGVLSLLINPLFILIVLKEQRLSLGNYKYLLLYFSLFNMSCSLCDVLVPMVVHDYKYAFSVFISDGLFEKYSPVNQSILAFRCSFISGTYAILHAHFVYRFLVLFKSNFLRTYFLPYGMSLCIVYLLFHLTFWTLVSTILMDADDERRRYMRRTIWETYQGDTFDLNMQVVLYKEGSDETIQKSVGGLVLISAVSVLSVVCYLVIGFLTIKKLNSQALVMSQKTKRLQRQLMYALIVQSVIPTVVSFFPCVISWYQPAFGVNLGLWTHHTSTIAISAFPFLDPLAILLFVPTFRKRLMDVFCGWRKGNLLNEQSNMAPSVDENVFSRATNTPCLQ